MKKSTKNLISLLIDPRQTGESTCSAKGATHKALFLHFTELGVKSNPGMKWRVTKE